MSRLYRKSVATFIKEIQSQPKDILYHALQFPYDIKLSANDVNHLPKEFFFGYFPSHLTIEKLTLNNITFREHLNGQADESAHNGTSELEEESDQNIDSIIDENLNDGEDSEAEELLDDIHEVVNSEGISKTFFSHRVPFWEKRLYFDYILVCSKVSRLDFKFLLPQNLSLDFRFNLHPHTFERPGPKPNFELPSGNPFFYFHEGTVSEDENVWLILEFLPTQKPDDLETSAILPKHLVDKWNSLKIDTF
jgi:hypothetical protein